ncbi:hypothetical protein LTR53_007249 [Teratosphaeriaceae sp. CCFEE 6253]|nr:hypothetical protein LTR53_007249 [Teratosphaeriaceae sp. CCFEE 6253]
MSDSEDPEIDPAMAAAMGFTGFGGQPGKKRKYDANDTFVDPGLATTQDGAKGRSTGKGANSLPLGARKPDRAQPKPSTPAREGRSVVGVDNTTGTEPAARHPSVGEASLQALRQGVPNERGDLVYFKPSFLEDPWASLKAR